ncbi:mitochondrial basic amino acids transporter [Diorhabda sublineata]|uniref:mitochondrial basic amino acids transporter n=1 Tax=Diorhabda sublineata TaxID=1163346 RepID=UPI0024E088CA|nr:mitochondrial basic amino acids transporter [Diorhabda sublineata]XP_056646957.1 mitochondrial basic amino acids transporter [Diorhabda sublineata]XP_056646958.1 mitochondrial basic amino acids transporter [Diorhabda sublineata]XP_056646959.1 mitochondrial basic amino acids transporter [Diorhabda sublineata]
MSLDFIAGCVGGVAGVFVGHPLDTVKVNLQTQSAKKPKYTGTLDCIKSLMVKEGIKGLYRGVTSPVAGLAALNAIVFGVYGNVQKNMVNPDSLLSHAIAGASAGLLTSFITSPMELVKSRMQVAGTQAGKNPLDCLIKIYTKKRLRGVFHGLGITIGREVPAFTTYFITYELLTQTEEGKIASSAQILFAGGMAGVVSWVIPYPVDVIKSLIQVDGITSQKYTGYYDCMKKTVSSQGYLSLYRGLTPTVIRAFPVNAVTFFVVTWTIRLSEMKFKTPENLHFLSMNMDVIAEERI